MTCLSESPASSCMLQARHALRGMGVFGPATMVYGKWQQAQVILIGRACGPESPTPYGFLIATASPGSLPLGDRGVRVPRSGRIGHVSAGDGGSVAAVRLAGQVLGDCCLRRAGGRLGAHEPSGA